VIRPNEIQNIPAQNKSGRLINLRDVVGMVVTPKYTIASLEVKELKG
jgi:hypothetical protein